MADRSDIQPPGGDAETSRRRASRAVASRSVARPVTRSASVSASSLTARAASARAKRKTGPLRTLAISAIVAGLVATVALPAYGALRPIVESQTLQQVSAADAQSLVVASQAQAPVLDRGDYAATTPDEIAAAQAAAAAADAAAARAQAAAASSSALSSVDLSMVSPGSGAVRWPLDPGSITFMGDGFLSRGGEHQGQDMLAAAGTPIFAAAAGVVDVSQESYGGYGVAVTISSVINGAVVYTTYGHMTYGSRVVSAGDTVAAGQLIGLVGSTGSSTANHLHFEVSINGSNVDPLQWLYANAG